LQQPELRNQKDHVETKKHTKNWDLTAGTNTTSEGGKVRPNLMNDLGGGETGNPIRGGGEEQQALGVGEWLLGKEEWD